MKKVDVLIAGQGLAGTAVALALRERGMRIFVVDRDEAVTSSKVAAGLITPITGKKFSPSWRVAELWPAAKEFWQMAEIEFGARFFHDLPITRLFKDADDASRWNSRKCEPGVPDFIESGGSRADGPSAAASRIHDEHGGFTMKNCGWVDTKALLAAARRQLESDNSFAVADIDPNAIAKSGSNLRWNEIEASRVVYCQGYAAAANPRFDWIPWRAAKGEILDVRFREPFPDDRILNRGSWLLPAGNGRFRTGATYAWHDLDTNPTPEARATLEERLCGLTGVSYDVVDQSAAVRPVIRESRILMGWHPADPKTGFFNGLGSKGVLTAPFFARQFAAALGGEGAIDPEVDLRKNL